MTSNPLNRASIAGNMARFIAINQSGTATDLAGPGNMKLLNRSSTVFLSIGFS